MVLTKITFNDIPYIKIDEYTSEILQYYSCNNTFWRKKMEKTKENYSSYPVFYYVFDKDDGNKFYIESHKENLTDEEAQAIYKADANFYQSFESLEEMIIDVIEAKSYADKSMHAGWYYFNNEPKIKIDSD